jgi:hypothetical protein
MPKAGAMPRTAALELSIPIRRAATPPAAEEPGDPHHGQERRTPQKRSTPASLPFGRISKNHSSMTTLPGQAGW